MSYVVVSSKHLPPARLFLLNQLLLLLVALLKSGRQYRDVPERTVL
jgi:hypothetical protein